MAHCRGDSVVELAAPSQIFLEKFRNPLIKSSDLVYRKLSCFLINHMCFESGVSCFNTADLTICSSLIGTKKWTLGNVFTFKWEEVKQIPFFFNSRWV